MRYLTNGWNLWFAATICCGVAGALKVSIGDGFGMAACGFAAAAIAAMVRDLA